MNDDPSDADLKERFAILREQESIHAPNFPRTLARAHAAGKKSSTDGLWRRRSLAAAFIAVVALLGLIHWINPAPEPPGPLGWNEALPIFLETHHGESGLFTSLGAGTDSLLPAHLRFKLF